MIVWLLVIIEAHRKTASTWAFLNIYVFVVVAIHHQTMKFKLNRIVSGNFAPEKH